MNKAFVRPFFIRPREIVEKKRMSAEWRAPGVCHFIFKAITISGVLRTTGVVRFFASLQRFQKLATSVVALVLLAASCTFAQGYNTVLGYSGFIVTPTAEIFADGQLTANIGRIPKLYADNYMPYDRTSFIVAMGFMPFLEASIGFIRPDNFQGGIGDRTVTVRFRLLKERNALPAIAVGFHDFFAIKDLNLEPAAAQHFTSAYIVATKKFALPLGSALRLNMGYGPNWLPSSDRQLTGLFWGVQYSPFERVQFLFENDAVHYNAGVRFCFFQRVTYMFSFWQLKYMMHQLSFSINLI